MTGFQRMQKGVRSQRAGHYLKELELERMEWCELGAQEFTFGAVEGVWKKRGKGVYFERRLILFDTIENWTVAWRIYSCMYCKHYLEKCIELFKYKDVIRKARFVLVGWFG